MYTSENNIAKKLPFKTASLSSQPSTMMDVELVKLFEQSLQENTPYLIELDNMSWNGWVKRLRKYWEEERKLSITYHALTNSVYVVPMN